jgi:hypothetical protein
MHTYDVLHFVFNPFFIYYTQSFLYYEEVKFVDKRFLTYVGHFKRRIQYAKH